MLVNKLGFLSLVCAALVLGLALTHDLEIPGKQRLSGAEWLTVHQTFYGGFAIVGGMAEILGLLSTGLLLFLLRKQQVALALTLVAALCMASMPATWQQIRNAWDSFHAASSVLAALSLVSLLIALLHETPASYRTRETIPSA